MVARALNNNNDAENRWDCGSGEGSVTALSPIELGQWQRVAVWHGLSESETHDGPIDRLQLDCQLADDGLYKQPI